MQDTINSREIKFEYGFTNHAPLVFTIQEIETGRPANIIYRDNAGRVKYRRQYTGYHDCNGKDIYEGDILYFPEIDERTEVVFDEGAFRILFSFSDESEVLTNKILDANYDVEVIGNIYSTPELIKS